MEYDENLFYGASPLIRRRARELRKEMTYSEKRLWAELINKKLLGFKFRRQHPLNKFIVDFYCHELKLVIEVDGSVHEGLDAQEYDEGRTFEIQEFGIQVLRFGNEEVDRDVEGVVLRIKEFIRRRTP